MEASNASGTLDLAAFLGKTNNDLFFSCEIIMDQIVLISKTPVKNIKLGT